ncbi:MAG: ACP S-malonyltransferase [Woeseiaceae bacterium]
MTLAFVFPGQGSQSVGMQSELAARYPQVEETYAEASSVLGFDLWDLVQNGPADELNRTVNTQPAMLTAGVAAWRAWQSAGGAKPGLMSGHSLGEYTALVCGGSLAFSDGIGLVRRRAELMQNAVPVGEGAMAAILGLDTESIMDVCSEASLIGVAEPVNFNSPGQTVVAGHKRAISQLVELAKGAGARRAILLPVSVPSHSSLMRQAGEALAEHLEQTVFRAPESVIVCAVDAIPYGDESDMRKRLSAQTYSPVRWVDVIQYMAGEGATSIVECGPGKVLTGLTKRIDRGIAGAYIDSPDSLDKAIEETSA